MKSTRSTGEPFSLGADALIELWRQQVAECRGDEAIEQWLAQTQAVARDTETRFKPWWAEALGCLVAAFGILSLAKLAELAGADYYGAILIGAVGTMIIMGTAALLLWGRKAE